MNFPIASHVKNDFKLTNEINQRRSLQIDQFDINALTDSKPSRMSMCIDPN